MISLDYIRRLMDLSNITTIGYSKVGELVKDDLLSNINTYKVEIDEMNLINKSLNSFLKIHKRDKLISNILSDSILDEKVYYVLDINDLFYSSTQSNKSHLTNSSNIRNLFESLNRCDDMYVGFILISETYSNIFNNEINIKGGSTLLYSSSLVLTINEDISIIKNRYL